MEAENLLREFGLTEYEIKAYMSLLKLGVATADQISNMGNIPLPRVYDTLVELQKKGFVLISKGRPKKFKPIDPKKSLKSLIDLKKKDFEKQIGSLKNDVNKIVKDLDNIQTVNSNQEKYDIWSTEKRSNIGKLLDQQKKMASKEILIFSGDMSWISEIMPIIKQSTKRGVKMRAIVHKPENKKWTKNIRMAKKAGINVKIGYTGLMRGHVIDDKTISIAIKQSDTEKNNMNGEPGSDMLSKYELLTSNNPILVSMFKENFEFWWGKL